MIRFGRTSSWSEGWRGKHSVTDIFDGDRLIGKIDGVESVSSREMTYSPVGSPLRSFGVSTLQEAKALIRKQFETNLG